MTETASPVVVVGLGQLGGVFSHGFLRSGHPVVPVLRDTSPAEVVRLSPEPALVLVAVGEDDLRATVAGLPAQWRTRMALLQNELLPAQWLELGVADPTVAVVWFEKKAGREVHNVLPTVLAGPGAPLLAAALAQVHVPTRTVAGDDLLHELVAKNLYILVLNLAGLAVKGSAGDLLTVHRALCDSLAREVIALERALVGQDQQRLDDGRLVEALELAIASDPGHGLAGRSAPRRLERSLAHARRLGLELPHLERLGREHLRALP